MVPQYREATPIILNDSLHMKGYGNALLRAYYNRLHLPSFLEFFEGLKVLGNCTPGSSERSRSHESKGHTLSRACHDRLHRPSTSSFVTGFKVLGHHDKNQKRNKKFSVNIDASWAIMRNTAIFTHPQLITLSEEVLLCLFAFWLFRPF